MEILPVPTDAAGPGTARPFVDWLGFVAFLLTALA